MAEGIFLRDHPGTDPRTHTERINPGTNPAHIPGLSPGGMEGPAVVDTERRLYRMTIIAKHGDVVLPPGTVVALLPHEVQEHHVDIEKEAKEQAAAEKKAAKKAAEDHRAEATAQWLEERRQTEKPKGKKPDKTGEAE